MFRTVIATAFIFVSLTSTGFAQQALRLSGHGLPPYEANTAFLKDDILGVTICGLPYDQAAIKAVWKRTAKSMKVSVANLSAEIRDRAADFEPFWRKHTKKHCKNALKYGKDMGYLPKDFRPN
jgi:hypothetical protein